MLKKKTLRAAIWALFLAYILLMIWLLFLRRTQWVYASYNAVPLKTVLLYFRLMQSGSVFVRAAIVNLVGNVVMFIPLGLFLPALWPGLRRLGRFVLTVAAAIIAVELLQFLFRLGACDIDDLLLNLVGAALGFGVFHLRPVRRFLSQADTGEQTRRETDVEEHL